MIQGNSTTIRLLERLLATCCGVLLVAWCLRVDVQPDLYFHLAAGRWILEHGLPHTNVFLAPNPDHAFVDHEWLFQVACWPLFKIGGARLLTIAKTLIVLATFALVAAACRRQGPRVRWVVIALALTVAGGRFILRPEVVSFLGVAAHLYLLTRDRGRLPRRTLILLTALQLVWSNTHGFSLLGPVLVIGTLGAAILHNLLWKALREGPLGVAPEGRIQSLLLLLCLEGAATMLNPYGLEAALYPFLVLARAGQDAASAGLSYRVVELTSPFAPSLRGVPEIRLYLLWLAAAPPLYAIALWRGRAKLEEGVMAFVLAAASVLYLRNLPLAALGLSIPTVAGLGALGDLLQRRIGPKGSRRGRIAFVLAGCAMSLLLARAVLDDRFHQNASYDARPGLGLGEFPTYPEAVAFLDRSPPRGALFNNFGAGHYLIYARDGARPLPSLCGNTDLYPRAYLRRYHDLVSGHVPLDPDLEAMGVSDIVVDHRVEIDTSVLRSLVVDPKWGLVHADPHAVVFRREAPDLDVAALTSSVLRGDAPWAFADEEPDTFGPTRALRALRLLPRERPVQPIGRLNTARLLEVLGKVEAARAVAKQASERAPDSPLVLHTLADLEHTHGDRDEARRLWKRLCELSPRDALPRVKLGLLEFREGRDGAKRAVGWFQAALEVDPDSRLALENLLTAYEILGDPVEIRRTLARTRDLRPAKRAYYVGAAALLEGDLERAEEGLAEAVTRDPRLSPALALLAQVLGQRGKLPEAEEAWARLCELTPRDASAWNALGTIRRLRGQVDPALAAWERAAALDSRETRALLDGGDLLLARGRPGTALSWIREALKRDPSSARALRLYEKATLEDTD